MWFFFLLIKFYLNTEQDSFGSKKYSKDTLYMLFSPFMTKEFNKRYCHNNSTTFFWTVFCFSTFYVLLFDIFSKIMQGQIHHLLISRIIHLICPLQFCKSIVLYFSWDHCFPQEKSKNKGYAKFFEGKQGVWWEMCKCRIDSC